jgi:hypothetical protein
MTFENDGAVVLVVTALLLLWGWVLWTVSNEGETVCGPAGQAARQVPQQSITAAKD